MTDLPKFSSPLRVLEFAEGFAGPVCGRMFAGLGHEVIKCEPPGGDYLRGRGASDPELMASGFRVLNAGKRSVVIDLDTDQGIGRARRLIESADVVISDLAPERLDRLGLRGPARRPGLVVVSLSSFGASGDQPFVRPDSLLAESFGGLAAMIGEPDRAPLSLGGEQTAYSAGFAGFFGAMLALREPSGDFVDVALSDVAAYMDWKSDVSYDVTGIAPRRSGARFGRWRMVPAADGWVGIVYQPEQWDAMVTLIDDPRIRDPRLETEGGRDQLSTEWWPAVQEWAQPLTRRDIFERAQRVGLAFGMSMDVADLATAEQYLFRGFIPRSEDETPLGPFFKSAELDWTTGDVPELDEFAAQIPDIFPAKPTAPAAAQLSADQGPLHGMLVLDLGTITAGAATGRLLADYGATVIKIEAPDHPDSFRTWIVSGTDPANQPEVSPAFESNNAGKLGVAMNLKTAGGLEAFLKLVATADVVLENFRVGVTERLGIDYQSLRRINPDLVYLSLSSQGQDGPEALYRSYGSTLDMLSGLASVTGYGDGLPVWSSVDVNYPDQVVSLLGAGLVAYSWLSHLGTHIDLSQRETISWTLADRIEYFRASGVVVPASGNKRPGADPHDVYACSEPDSWIAIACFTDEQRSRLSALVAHGTVGRGEGVTLDDSVGRWARSVTRDEALRMLRAAEIPSAPVLGAGERAYHPHFTSRRVFLSGAARRKGFPLVLDGYRPSDPSPAPRLGQHTEVVLTHSGEAGIAKPAPEPSVPEEARAVIT